jgi:formate dehydrogenase subunit beta
MPVIYDYLIDGDFEKEVKEPEEESYTYERLTKELEKCILCYSCRQACYGCYCKTCFADRTEPKWMPNDVDMSSKLMFHLGRISHLAGRCVECGACERACPSDVNIRYIIREASKYCDEMYGYRAGLKEDEEPALVKFDKDDEERGFLED